ncbi:unnamed protein product [Adineta steineri]|uniref:Uncharacterized protein n=1 Tax=Adineta steineri TaxID=433720 RepID=A0A819U5G7_9BILA|nr:unnamed protein product [Adineta steineri]CAF4089173.1 unnamed protein product [Adineta steineri]
MYYFILLYTIIIHIAGVLSDTRLAGLVVDPNFAWKKQTVTISFLNGNEKERLEFRKLYFQWFACTHIHFVEIALSQGADIRVGFGLDKGRSWSLIGSLSVEYSVNLTSGKIYRDFQRTRDPSMVVASISKRLVLHEGGHSLSAKHEHGHSLANISWHPDFISGNMFPSMTIEYIQNNFLQTFPLNQSLGPFDR